MTAVLPLLAYGVGAAALGYAGVAVWRVHRFARAAPPPTVFAPAVSVLKPLCGLEPGLCDNLRSHFQLDYPAVQIVFGVRDASDPAPRVVERLRAEFPEADVAVVVDPRRSGINPKVSNLINMTAAARHDVLVLSDSDIRVRRDYLEHVVAPLADPRIGAVTCAYTARPATSCLAARLAALQINDGFLPLVLVAAYSGEADFCMGSTIALRRDALRALGGFPALQDVLADDYEIGHRLVARGYRVRLSDCIVETVATETDLKEVVLHELRWARTIRAVRPLGFAGLFITQTLPVSVLAVLALALDGKGGGGAIALLAFGTAARLLLHLEVVRRFAAPRSTSWLVPLRDALSLGIWAATFTGRQVTWRGKPFAVGRGGRLAGTKGVNPQ